MINLVVRFDTLINLLIFLSMVTTITFWAYQRLRRNLTVSIVPVIVANFILLGVWAAVSQIDHDGTEHLHAAWLMSRGFVPYNDFWMHQSPFLWIMLIPLVKSFEPSPVIFDIIRIISGLVFLLNAYLGWQIARKAWQDKARLAVYLLVLSSAAIGAEYLWLRPDIFMTFFLLAVILISMEIPGKRVLPSFLAGIAFSLAASFMTKQYFLFFLPLIAVFLGEKRMRTGKLAAYFLGLAVGSLPLLSYLMSHGIFQDFVFWVFEFNKEIIVFRVFFPFMIGMFAGWGAYRLLKSFRESRRTKTLLLIVAFCLSTLSSLTSTIAVSWGHYLAFWLFLCAIIASGCPIPEVFERVSSRVRRAVIIGVFFSLLLIPGIMYVGEFCDKNFPQDKRAVVELMKYCKNDHCLVFLPLHPVFTYDATRLYSDWQYHYITRFSPLKQDAMRQGVLKEIMASRPAVVVCSFRKKDFVLDLFQKKLISAADYKELVLFFKENYTRKRIGQEKYYIRNDKLK
ncbi:MAG TPA: hypothetical protein PL155_01420 [Candidatus Omnitrophota bacterium]|nr:hypothetical protein [Candidatus Omnitrophota bacterium]HPD84854.1 hypothetical protein [Candidatus Omnitrophota bacterium]HRZ03712.1 hypothetical protein [Candidatus Omnitrophota bacterium]